MDTRTQRSPLGSPVNAPNGPSTARGRAVHGILAAGQDRSGGWSPPSALGNADSGKSCNPSDMNRWGVVALAYALLGTMAVALAIFWRHTSPWVHPAPWLSLADRPSREGFSLVLGVALGGLVVFATRLLVGRVEFARRLHSELRPLARSMSSSDICLLAIFSALGEELLFRGLLQPWLGLLAQAAIFGGLHQVGGPSRWVWMSWSVPSLRMPWSMESTCSFSSATIRGRLSVEWVVCSGSRASPASAYHRGLAFF